MKDKRSLEDTQELNLTGMEETQPLGEIKGTVRELSPLPKEELPRYQNREASRQVEKKRSKGFGVKIGLGILAFLVAMAGGFFVAGFLHDSGQKKEASYQEVQQNLAVRKDKLAKDEAELTRQREALAREKAELEERRARLKTEAAKLDGRNEQIEKETRDAKLGGIFDKVTGKDAERKKAAADNKAKQENLAKQADEVDKAIAHAQQNLAEINAQLDNAAAMKQELDAMRLKAQATYEENKDTIDTVLHYAGEGVKLIVGALQR